MAECRLVQREKREASASTDSQATPQFCTALYCPDVPDTPGKEIEWRREPLSHDGGNSRTDAFRDAVLSVFQPIFTFLREQEAAAVAAPGGRYPDFENALHHGLAGHFALVARGDQLPVEEAFELVAASAELYRELGFPYILTSATNQWTGAAFTALGGVPVHFEPYLARQRVAASPEPIDTVSSSSGYLSAKDSGSMIFVLRLA